MRTSTTEVMLRDLVIGSNEGRYPLPQFQREYVWKPRQILNLLDSLSRGFPIGSFYLWKPPHGTKIDPKQSATGQPTVGAAFDGYLIDGQQRLTSLEAAFGLCTAETKHESLVECYMDLLGASGAEGRDTKLFVSPVQNRHVKVRVARTDISLLPVSTFLQPVDPDLRRRVHESLKQAAIDDKRIQAALRNFDSAVALLERRVPVTTIYDVPDEDVIPVFSRLNKGGTTLRAGDVRAAELARGKSADVLRRIRDFVVTDRPKRLGFGFSFAFRALVVFHRESAQFSRLKGDWVDQTGPHGRTLAASWQAAEKALSAALKFVDEELGWCRKALVPSANALIVLAFAIDSLPRGSIDEKAAGDFKRWLCLTALRGVFQGSVETTIDRFVKAVKKSSGTAANALVKDLKRDEGRPIDPVEDIRNVYSPMWGPGTQVMMAWLTSLQACDWVGEDQLVALARGGPTSLPGGNLTVHHIVARKLLANDYDPEDANDLGNYALVSGTANSQFGDDLPLDVYKSLDTEQRKRASVQFFGMEAGDRMSPESYLEFLDWRAARLAKAWNAWLGLDSR